MTSLFSRRRLAGAAAVAITVLITCTRLAGQQSGRPARADSARADSARAERLRTVTITTTPAEREEPRAVEHLSIQAIRLTPATTAYDLMRQAAGLDVHQQGQGPGFASDASLRGFSSDHSTDLALWVDGVPVNEPVNGHAEGYNDWTVLFPSAIRDIDVIRGPSSALFGNFALAGVINVRTLERMKGTEANVSGGSFGRADATVLSGFDHGATGGGVFGAHFEHENGFRPNGAFDVAQLHARVVHDVQGGLRIDAGAELLGSKWKSSGFLSENEFAAREWSVVSNPSDGGEKQRVQERVSLRAMLGDAVWRTTAYATQSRWQLFLTIPPAGGRFEGSGSQSEEEDHRYGFGVTSALSGRLGILDAAVGVESRWDHSRYENYFTTGRSRDSVAVIATAEQASGAVFAQLHADVTQQLRLDLGVRADALYTHSALADGSVLSDTHSIVSPKLGAMYRVVPSVGVYANVSKGFRAANGLVTAPSLVPIVAWSYEGGVKVDSHGASYSAAWFEMDVSDEQTFKPVTLASTNGGASKRTGVDLDWSIPVGELLHARGSWTFLDARYRHLSVAPADGGGPPDVLDGLRVYNTARYTGTASLEIAPPGAAWRLRVGGNWVGPYSPFDEPGVVLGGYGLAHVSGTVRWAGAEWTLGVRNLMDRAYPELVAGHVVAPGQPRALQLGARFLW